jgi:hypothetical protein
MTSRDRLLVPLSMVLVALAVEVVACGWRWWVG